ncbi:LytTR family DNA-binding domain-containing protein [Lachnospiraceae bacterium 54-53]
MKIALFTNEKQQDEFKKAGSGSCRNNPSGVDCYSMEERVLQAMEGAVYDAIVVYPGGKPVSWREIIRQVNSRGRDRIITLIDGYGSRLKQTKYTTFFNGRSCILDTRDILFLESYYRKASVVVGKGRIRIRARLDEEEKKLPKDQFVRINRHNIINMQYIRNVKGEAVEMQNGEILYVNVGRKNKFQKKYRVFLEENHMVL